MATKQNYRLLRIDSSARAADSVSRRIGDEVERRLASTHPALRVTRVDLAQGQAHIDADWVAANFTAAAQRNAAQRARLVESDRHVELLRDADAVLLTVPVYNFSVPSTLKAWIDQVCRAGLTFRYTPEGPQGLLRDRPVYLAMASGGVPFGSPADFASGYLRQVFAFLGIHDLRLVGAERVAAEADAAYAAALSALDQWLPADAGVAA